MQTGKSSAIEALINEAVGFTIAIILWKFAIAPYFDIVINWYQLLLVNAIFVSLGTLRIFIIRRFFIIFDKG